MYEIMIIGGGPAGLSAGVYAARKRLQTLLVSVDIGGQLNNNWGIENYLGYQFIEGPELVEKFSSQVNQFPIEQKIGEKVRELITIEGGFEAVSETDERYQAKAVILATGKKPRRLKVPGENEFMGKGVTYCAICDGPLFAGQRVAVIGGGNSALEAALDMVKIAEHVALVSLAPLSGDAVLAEKVRESRKVDIYLGYRVERITGEQLVRSVLIKNDQGDDKKELSVGGVFVEIGLEPNADPVAGLLKLNQKGEVPVSYTCETTVPGLYAAGDVTNIPEKQILIAAGEGAKAALQAHRYLQHLTT
jgi:alkyl hydroperoxide reductase subunit F